jgi:hypothetical protein
MYQRRAVIRFVAEDLERVAIIPVEAVKGSEPHKTIVIPVNAPDGVIGQSLFYAQVFCHRSIYG